MARSIKNIFSPLSAADLTRRKKIKQPLFMQPMLATLTDKPFSDDTWIYEQKFDGVRCIVVKKNGNVSLISRNQHNMNSSYPEIVQAFERQAADNFMVDGEIVALSKQDVSDFQLLQGRMHLLNNAEITQRSVRIPICLYLFDVIYADGYDLRSMPLLARKQVLKKIFSFNKTIVYTDHIEQEGIKYFKYACRMHWEGIIAKRAESMYVGKRSTDWLKFKCMMQQELIIVGYTEPRGSRGYFGALLVGYYKNNRLIYAGKVGTGYSEETLVTLGTLLRKLEIKKCPLAEYDESNKGIHWVKPTLVAEFQFAQWTNGGKLRVGRYKGLRDDKDAKDVVRERPKTIRPH